MRRLSMVVVLVMLALSVAGAGFSEGLPPDMPTDAQEGCLWRCSLLYQYCQSEVADACYYDVCDAECSDERGDRECTRCWTNCYYSHVDQCEFEYDRCVYGCERDPRW